MANRATLAGVQELFSAGELVLIAAEGIDLDVFINTANLWMNQWLLNKGFSAAYLKEIETWLAAHFASMNSPLREEEEMSVDGASSDFSGKATVGIGIEETRFGRQANMLSGGTIREQTKQKAFFAVVSKGERPPPSA